MQTRSIEGLLQILVT